MTQITKIIELESLASYMAEDMRISVFDFNGRKVVITICNGLPLPHNAFVQFITENFTRDIEDKRLPPMNAALKAFWSFAKPPLELIERATNKGWVSFAEVAIARKIVKAFYKEYLTKICKEKGKITLIDIRKLIAHIDEKYSESWNNPIQMELMPDFISDLLS